MSHFGLAMLLWWPREEQERESVTKGGTRGKRPASPDLTEDGAQLVREFEDVIRRANFCLRSKGPENAQTRRVDFEAIEAIKTEDGTTKSASSLSGPLLPNVKSLAALLSRYTFKLVDENDAATLQTEPHWELELHSVRGTYEPKYLSNVVVVLYDQLSQMTDKWLDNNCSEDTYGGRLAWSLDPEDIFGIPPTNSLRDGTTCDYADRNCVRVVSMCGGADMEHNHSAQGIAASSATVGAVGMSIYSRQKKFPPAGYVYVVPFELPESAIVERELTAELDCALCFESRNTRMDGGMIIGGCGHYICKACCEDAGYSAGIKKLKTCPTCRRPCALAPELKREKTPVEFEYHWRLKALLEANGFVFDEFAEGGDEFASGEVKQVLDSIGLILTKDFIECSTQRDIEENCGFSPELSQKVLVLWEAAVKYVAEYKAEYEVISFLIGHGFDVLTAKEISDELFLELDTDIALINDSDIDELKCLDKREKQQLKGLVQAAQHAVPGDAGMNYAPKFVDCLIKGGFSSADADAVAVKLGITDTELCVSVTENEIRELRLLTNEEDKRGERVLDWDVWERALTESENVKILNLIWALQSVSNEGGVTNYWRQHYHKDFVEFLKLNGIDTVLSARFAKKLEMEDTDSMRNLSKEEIHSNTISSDTEEKIWRLRQMVVWIKEPSDLGVVLDFVDYLKNEGFSDNNADAVAVQLGITDTVLCVCVSPAEIDALCVWVEFPGNEYSQHALSQKEKWAIRRLTALLKSSDSEQFVKGYWDQHYDANTVEFLVKNGVDRDQSQKFADKMRLEFTDDLKLSNRQDIEDCTKFSNTAKIWRLQLMLAYMTASASHIQTIQKAAAWVQNSTVGVKCLLTQLHAISVLAL